MAERIQRKRSKGWRMPEGAVYVGRPTRWGNPFIVGQLVTPPVERYDPAQVYTYDAAQAVRRYRRWLLGSANRCADLVPELAGKDLACWCPLDQPCHADVLLQLANLPKLIPSWRFVVPETSEGVAADNLQQGTYDPDLQEARIHQVLGPDELED